MPKPLISIGMITFNDEDVISKCLDAIYDSDFPYGEIEIIVVDNNSSDGSKKLIKKKYPAVKLIENHENSGTAAINLALPHCKGKYFWYLIPDIEIDRKCLRNLYEFALKHPNTCPIPIIYDGTDRKCHFNVPIVSRSFYETFVYDNEIARLNKPYEVATFACVFMERKVLDEIGYFFDRNYFFYAEDFDLGLRLRLAGYPLWKLPNAIIYHRTEKKTKKFHSVVKLVFLNERNLLFTYFKVCSFKSLLLFFPYVALIRILSMLKDIFTLNFSSLFGRVKAYFWIIFHPAMICRSRKETQKTRKMPDKYVFRLCNEKKFLSALLTNSFKED